MGVRPIKIELGLPYHETVSLRSSDGLYHSYPLSENAILETLITRPRGKNTNWRREHKLSHTRRYKFDKVEIFYEPYGSTPKCHILWVFEEWYGYDETKGD